MSSAKENSKSKRGLRAANPTQIPFKGWWDISKRVVKQTQNDHLQIVAAGVAFYLFLAVFPAIAATLSIYGLIVSPAEAGSQLSELTAVLPREARDLIDDIAQTFAARSDPVLGWSALISIVLSIWSTNKGTKALFEGLNIAYNENDNRGIIKSLIITISFSLATIVTGLLAIVLIIGIPAVTEFIGISEGFELVIDFVRWSLAATIFATWIATVCRFAPHREDPQWKWVSVGSVIATVLWLLGSSLFSIYSDNFGSYGETYGSLAAAVVLMLWLFVTAFCILLGGEINSEMEHQTGKDTTTGPKKPLGERGAYYADHVAEKSSK